MAAEVETISREQLKPAFAAHGVAKHFVARRDNIIPARCGIWTDGTPMLNGSRVGVIGHYSAMDELTGVAVLRAAEGELRRCGFRSVVGPMDGNTWRRYRLLTRRGTEPPFFLEPDNPDDWPMHFERAGFAPLARYFSSVNNDLTFVHPRAAENLSKLNAAGITLRNIDVTKYEDELSAVYDLSAVAFVDNFLYTPISRVEFIEMYRPLRQMICCEMVLLAEKDAQLIGFIFGVPDVFETKRSAPLRTAIAKSMAVHPDHAGVGLGGVLMDQFHQAARQLGYSRVIHALMHENNHSLKLSARYGQPIRQYTLFWKPLT